MHPATLRLWVNQAEVDKVDKGARPGRTTADGARIDELERENRELWRANEISQRRAACRPGLPAVQRGPPNALWVADITYSAQLAVMCSSVGGAR
jgi:transposase-like protein